jgi:hypothetical protein
MWNPDQVYLAEQARRAELYTEAEQVRQAQTSGVSVSPAALLGRAVRRLSERLVAAQAPQMGGEPRR